MKSVWLVLKHWNYEGYSIASAHGSKEGADAEAARLRTAMALAQAAQSDYWSAEDPAGPEPEWPYGVPDCDEITVSNEFPVGA
jgi:hypothetical protein